MKNIIRLVCIVGVNIDILPHTLDHYTKLGVTHISFGVNITSHNDELLTRTQKLVAEYNAEIDFVHCGPWHEDTNKKISKLLRQRYPDDWCILADQDELQVYPAPLHNIITFLEGAGLTYMEGCLLDRVSASGSLTSVESGSIWTQYPYLGFFAPIIAGCYPKKVVLVKGDIEVEHGQHSATGSKCPWSKYFAIVNHFKWTDGLTCRLATRSSKYKSGEWKLLYQGSPDESDKLVSYLEKCGNKIELDDPRFMFEFSPSSAYGHSNLELIQEKIRKKCY